jgi:Domain of unknown function (DUF6883)
MPEVSLHPTRVPGAEEAVAPDHKFRDYLLNLDHPGHGAAKARFFLSIGWGQDRWEELRDLFLAQLPYVHGRFSRENEYNEAADYEAVIEVPRENGEMVPVGTYWQVHPDYPTKFLTAYPL